MATVKIEVTEDDIAKGTRGDGKRCPVAISVNRAIGVSVWVLAFSVSSLDGRHVAYLPFDVIQWIAKYDRTPIEQSLIAPLTFDLQIEEE